MPIGIEELGELTERKFRSGIGLKIKAELNENVGLFYSLNDIAELTGLPIENDTDKLRIMNRLAKIDHASKPEAKNVAKQEIRRVFSAKQGENYWTSLDSKLSNDLTEAVEDEETDGRVDE